MLEESVNWDVLGQSNSWFMLSKLTTVDCLTAERNVFSLKQSSMRTFVLILSKSSQIIKYFTWELFCCKKVAELLTVSVKTYGSSWISCWHDMTNCGSFSGNFLRFFLFRCFGVFGTTKTFIVGLAWESTFDFVAVDRHQYGCCRYNREELCRYRTIYGQAWTRKISFKVHWSSRLVRRTSWEDCGGERMEFFNVLAAWKLLFNRHINDLIEEREKKLRITRSWFVFRMNTILHIVLRFQSRPGSREHRWLKC